MRTSKTTIALFSILLISINNYEIKAQVGIPNFEVLVSSENIHFDSLCTKIDSLWAELQQEEDFEEENYEDSYMQYARWKRFWKPRIGGLNPDHLGYFGDISAPYRDRQGQRSSNCSGGNLNSSWRPIGPFQEISNKQHQGFIQSVAVNPSNEQIIFAGSESGGLFKTINGGVEWKNKTDVLDVPGLGIMDIQIDPFNSNHIIASTGSSHGYGVGIINSTTNGETWSISTINFLSPEDVPVFKQIRFDQNNQGHVWAICNNKQLYFSIDGGLTFDDILTKSGTNFNPHDTNYPDRILGDLEIVPANSNHDPIIVFSTTDDNASNQGGYICISPDDGITWTYITPEPYIERISIDYNKVSGISPNTFKALYSVSQPVLKITEISQDLSIGSGTYPSFINPSLTNDYVEITNLARTKVNPSEVLNLSGYVLERWYRNSGNVFHDSYDFSGISLGQEVIVFSAQTIGIGTGIDLALHYYSPPPGNSFPDLASSEPALYILKAPGGGIIDMVAVNGFDKSGIIDEEFEEGFAQEFAGPSFKQWDFLQTLSFSTNPTVCLNGDDNNTASNWINTISGNIGILNTPPGGFTIIKKFKHIINSYNILTQTWNATPNHKDEYEIGSATRGMNMTISKNSMEFKLSDNNSDIAVAAGMSPTYFSNLNSNVYFRANYTEDARHADIRDIVQIPGSNNFLIATDGGVSKTLFSSPNTFLETNISGKGFRISDFSSTDSPPNNPELILTGAYHNGFWKYVNGDWIWDRDCGDGLKLKYGDKAIDQTNTIKPMWVGQCNGSFLRWDGSNYKTLFATPSYINTYDADHVALLKFHRNNLGVDELFFGGTGLYKLPIVSKTTIADADFITVTNNLPGHQSKGMISAFDISEQNGDTIIVCYARPNWGLTTVDDIVWISYDHGISWNDITLNFPVYGGQYPQVFMGKTVSDVIISPNDPLKIWVSFNGFDFNMERKIVYSSDGGQSFTDITQITSGSTNLPVGPINKLLYQPDSDDGIYVGTDEGVYYRDNSLSDWSCFSNAFPCNIVTDLSLNPCAGIIRASTYGAAMWESPMVKNIPHEISGNVTWSTSMNIEHDIVILPNSTLTITGNGTQISFGGGVKIIVSKSATLTVNDHAELKSECNYMWGGIDSYEESQVYIIDATVRDAYRAVTMSHKSYYKIINSTFENNYIGFYSKTVIGSYALGYIVGNSFSGTGVLKKNLVDFSNTPLLYPYAGIYLDGLQIPFNLSGNANNFHHLNNGIVLFSTDFQIANCIFDNILNFDNINMLIKGCAIQAEGLSGYFKFKVEGNLSPVTITNTKYGVYVTHMGTEIKSINISTSEVGIWIEKNNAGLTAQVSTCNISCKNLGIEMWQNIGSAYQWLIGNIISVGVGSSGLGGSGIRIDDSKTSSSNILVSGNIIDVYSATGGITLNFGIKSKIFENIISLHSASRNYYGVGVFSNDNCIVECNQVHGSGSGSLSLQRGFLFSKSLKSTVACNTEENTKYGFEFDDICDATNFQENTMSSNWAGLFINDNGVIGIQHCTGNRWDCSTSFGSGYEAINLDLSRLADSQFDVNPAITCASYSFAISPNTTDPNSGWFFPSNDDTKNNCALGTVCSKPSLTSHEGLTEMDELVAQNLIGFFNYDDETRIAARKNLYDKLDNNAQLIASSIYQQFYNSFSNNPIGELKEVHNKFVEAFKIDSIDLTEIENRDSLIKTYDGNIDSLNRVLIITTNDIQIQSLKNQIVFYSELKKILKEHGALHFREIDSVATVHLISSKYINEGVSSNEQVIHNLKEVNRIFESYFERKDMDFTDDEKQTILFIASLCPFESGEAVYQARSLALKFEKEGEYIDAAICQPYGYQRMSKDQELGELNVIVFPNPSNNDVNFIFTQPVSEDFKIKFYDSELRLIDLQSFKKDSRSAIYSTSKFENGVYFYTVEGIKNSPFQGKLVVLH